MPTKASTPKLMTAAERNSMYQTQVDEKVAKESDPVKKAALTGEDKPKEKTQEEKDTEELKRYKDSLKKSTDDIGGTMQAGVAAESKATKEYTKATDALVKQTQGLSKWHEGLVTSYEGIAGRYKKAFEESEKQRDIESKTAQRDYGSNAALMSKAASVGMSGQGPMTGAQQQLMMSTSQQQATNAYAIAQDRVTAADLQRKQLGAKVIESSMNQELANRQSGYNMASGMIQGQNTLAGQKYGANMQQISDEVQAGTYKATAGLNIENAGMQYGLGMRGMREGQEATAAQLQAMKDMPQAHGASQLGTGINRGIAGAAALGGLAVATGGAALIPAIAGGVLGFGSSFFE